MELPSEGVEERAREIETYLDFLRMIQDATNNGPPRIVGSARPIDTEQQRILLASVYMQLYSAVEATITRCLNYVTEATIDQRQPLPGEISDKLRRLWVREMARTHVELTPEHRLDAAIVLCDHLVEQLPVNSFKISRNAGNWDDDGIEEITRRLGCTLAVPISAYQAAKRKIRNDKNALGLVKWLRNQLAHGEVSFAQCAEGVTVDELVELSHRTCEYLKGVAASFEAFVTGDRFMRAAQVEPTE